MIKIVLPKKEVISNNNHYLPEELSLLADSLKNKELLEKELKEKARNISEIPGDKIDEFFKWIENNITVEYSKERMGIEFISNNNRTEVKVVPKLSYILFWLFKTWNDSWEISPGSK